MDKNTLYTILRYAFQIIIIYLILRYVPYIAMDVTKALIITAIVTLLIMILEFVYVNILNKQGNNCPCVVPPPKQGCRLVCDNVEPFAEMKHETKPAHVTMPAHVASGIRPGQMASGVKPGQVAMPGHVASGIRPGQMMGAEHVNVPKPGQMMGVPQEHVTAKPNYMMSTSQEHNMPQEHVGVEQEQGFRRGYTGRVSQEQEYAGKVDIPQEGRQDVHLGMAGASMPFTPDYLRQVSKPDMEQAAKNRAYWNEREIVSEENAHNSSNDNSPFQQPGPKSQTRAPIQYNRVTDGDIINDMVYTDHDFNSLPVGTGYKSFPGDYGWSMIPPENWSGKRPVRNLLCVPATPEERSPVFPMLSMKETADLKDFNYASHFTGYAGINTKYIDEKLNSGR